MEKPMDEYEPAGKVALVDLQRSYAKLRIGEKENCIWCSRINGFIKKVGNKYDKDNIKLISHLFIRLPTAYAPVKVAIQNCGSERMGLKKVQKDLVSLWKELDEENEGEESKKDIAKMANEEVEKKGCGTRRRSHTKNLKETVKRVLETRLVAVFCMDYYRNKWENAARREWGIWSFRKPQRDFSKPQQKRER
jgi:hypothetical protein